MSLCHYICVLLMSVTSWQAEYFDPKTSGHQSVFDSTWVEVIQLDSTILLDMRYATQNNFVQTVLYDCPRCYLNKTVAEKLVLVHQSLQLQGYGIKLYDCYRPLPVQEKLWKIMPNASYVTPPSKGSMHNRGLAVDLTVVDQWGKEVDMGTDFDFFGKRAHQDHMDLPAHILDNRRRLRSAMEAHGFKAIRTEWWHYSFYIPGQEVADWKWNCNL